MRAGRNHNAVGGNLTRRRLDCANLMPVEHNGLCGSRYQRSAISHRLLDQPLNQLGWIRGVPILFEKDAAVIMRRKRGIELMQCSLIQDLQLDAVFAP